LLKSPKSLAARRSLLPTRAFHVVIVEDDEVTRAKLSGYLEAAGYRVSASDGQEMWKILADDPADLLFLDINLPGEDGLDLTRQVRSQSGIGIILVTGRTDEVDRVVGLEIGADDYVTKPFNPRELLARGKNLLRRTAAVSSPDGTIKRFAGWRFNLRARRLTSPEGTKIPLTRAEFELLNAFVDRAGMVLSRDRLLSYVTHRSWEPSDRTIDVLVRRLRRKIEIDPKNPELIMTAHGEGYVFAADVEESLSPSPRSSWDQVSRSTSMEASNTSR
jgi:two-component system torCAD operon response regulator TorR